MQGLKAEALSNAIRLYCLVSNLQEDTHIIWYKDEVEISNESENYKVQDIKIFNVLRN